MSRVEVAENSAEYREFDALDGAELLDGERIIVTWPDGSRTSETVRVERDARTVAIAPCDYAQLDRRRAFVDIGARGIVVPMRLVGIDVERSPDNGLNTVCGCGFAMSRIRQVRLTGREQVWAFYGLVVGSCAIGLYDDSRGYRRQTRMASRLRRRGRCIR